MGTIPPNSPPHGPNSPLGGESDKEKAIALVEKIQEDLGKLIQDIKKNASGNTVFDDVNRIYDSMGKLSKIKLPMGVQLEKSTYGAITSLKMAEVGIYEMDHAKKDQLLGELSSLQPKFAQLLHDIKSKM